jgi:regulator of protease activity HflC (stomatin/prohibitin superfamily)
MIVLKYVLFVAGFGLFAAAVVIVMYDIYQEAERRRLLARGELTARPTRVLRWQAAGKLLLLAWLPVLASQSIVVVPDGMAGVRVSQISGARPGALFAGVHLVIPLVDSVTLYDVRENVFSTIAVEAPGKKAEVLKVQSKEGLGIGLAVAVRYRLDSRRLDYIHANLPQPLDEQIIAPVVASVFRQLVPNYLVKEVFATKHDELRQRASDLIVQRLAADGIEVKEVLLRDTLLPAEYAKGLESLLVKEQESERLTFDIEIKQKQVRTAELEAEADKIRQIKAAEGQAATRVLQAKGESDAMQFTLPLKQKQIEQSRLEAEARKEATLKNADAAAQAKVIDSKAELERRKLLAEAEGNRIRVTSSADAERMKMEALLLKQNPLLIQKIIAERLSDKLQIMMVPSDGKFFFTNDVFRGMTSTAGAVRPEEGEDPPPPAPRPKDRP